MFRRVTLLVALGCLAWPKSAAARTGDFSVYFSTGAGALYNANPPPLTPFNFSMSVSGLFSWAPVPIVSIDAGLEGRFPQIGSGVFGAVGASLHVPVTTSLFFRPGLRLLMGAETSGGQPIFNIGMLIGAGLEYRWRHVGIFAEVTVTPYFSQFYMPIEARIGIAVHF